MAMYVPETLLAPTSVTGQLSVAWCSLHSEQWNGMERWNGTVTLGSGDITMYMLYISICTTVAHRDPAPGVASTESLQEAVQVALPLADSQ